MLNKIWDVLVRWRTYFVNGVLFVLTIAPEVLNAPEVLAVVPAEYQRYFLAALFLINIWMRPRPASVASDLEVRVKKAISRAEGPAVVEVKALGRTEARIDA